MGQNGTVTGRFAPSPSGRMHLGNLFSSLLAWLFARSAGGRILLRLEDLDPDRTSALFGDQIAEDLRWLGLDWDGETVCQSGRTGAYEAAFETLRGMGLIYPCFCSRAERLAASAPHRSDGTRVYDGRCRRLTDAEREERARRRDPAWRVMVPDEEVSFTDQIQGAYTENLTRDCGDFIVRRPDGVFAYQLAVVVDDAAMGVNQVVRGSDLLSSSCRQIYLQRLLGLETPAYAHVPLLLAPGGRRLSKRDQDLGLDGLKERFSPEELTGVLAFLAGQLERPEPVAPRELAGMFRPDRVPAEDIVVQPELFRLT